VYTRIYFLRFPKQTSDKPVIYHLVKHHEVEVNILRAEILPQREGVMILELTGTKHNVKEALSYLDGLGVHTERLAAKVSRDEQRCFQCGVCTGVCPVGALTLRQKDMAVLFDAEKCTGCGQCVLICSVRAMELSLGARWLQIDGVPLS
jgi:ferredoxin